MFQRTPEYRANKRELKRQGGRAIGTQYRPKASAPSAGRSSGT